MSAPVWTCRKCEEPVTADGFIAVDEIHAYQYGERVDNGPQDDTQTIGEMLAQRVKELEVGKAAWSACHSSCSTETPSYWFEIETVATWHQVFERQHDLEGKVWHPWTNWTAFVLQAAQLSETPK